MTKQNFKLTIEYDGTNYLGFQVQAKGVTIQSAVEEACEKLFCQKLRIVSCGRTDSGVHAEEHVVNVVVDTKLKIKNIRDGLNRYLPRDIAVLSVRKVPLSFHARFAAKKKTYEYRIVNRQVRSPLDERYAYFIPQLLDVVAMRKALAMLIGKHDFRSFASQMPDDKNTVRTMFAATITKRNGRISIRLTADGFLYNMVRAIVGTVCLVGKGSMTLDEFRAIVDARSRMHRGPTIPSQGLRLLSVRY